MVTKESRDRLRAEGKCIFCKKPFEEEINPRNNQPYQLCSACRAKERERQKGYRRTAKTRYRDYFVEAARANRVFDLTFEQFMTFAKQPCYLCGDVSESYGLDRVDTAQGYTLENTKSCCKYCNRAKNDQSLSEFLDRVKRIYANHIERER